MRWLDDAIFYEIYPQSFYDTNADGIGDLNGITEKLDYIRALGFNALWINPCYDSPFKDAGYDVRDYRTIAPRYGTNEDMKRLLDAAHARGIRVLLDLVPGHSSEEHEWFKMSCHPEPNAYSGRYIWTNYALRGPKNMPFIAGEAPRNGAYVLNYFKSQPALNYGFYEVTEPWQKPMDDPDCLATGEAMMDIMRFWMDMGCDGFRVDMAYSLVKADDAEHHGTQRFWRRVRAMMDREYPECALISEWNDPERALRCGFHMDFYLSEYDSGLMRLIRNYDGEHDGVVRAPDRSFFKPDGIAIEAFYEDYLPKYMSTKDDGLFCFVTGNHDNVRLAANLTPEEMALYYTMLFTMPGAPFMYYGDEIGMRYQPLPTKEGGYYRTGARTPMQWSRRKNLGFSEGRAEDLYLPVDSSADAPTVEAQAKDPDSLLNHVRRLTALRHAHPELWAYEPFEPLVREGRLLAYRRGRMIVAIAPQGGLALPLDRSVEELYRRGDCRLEGGTLRFEGPASWVGRETE